MTGEGKYGPFVSAMMEAMRPRGIALIITGGLMGNGIEVQATDPEFLAALPGLLRTMADSIEEDTRLAATGGKN